MAKRFPMTIEAAPGASLTLNPDGSWSGDRGAFLEAVSNLEDDTAHPGPILLWLVANAIQKVDGPPSIRQEENER